MNKVLSDTEIAKRISILRKELKYSLRDLAEYVGVSHNTINKWCEGDIRPSNKNLPKLAQALGVDVTYLMFKNYKKEETTADKIYDLTKLLNPLTQDTLYQLTLILASHQDSEERRQLNKKTFEKYIK